LGEMTRLGPRDPEGHHAASCEMRADILNGLHPSIVSNSTGEAPGWIATGQIGVGTLSFGFVLRFPQWSNIDSLSGPIRSEWDRFIRSLWIHERGHTDVTMSILGRFKEQFEALRVAAGGASAQAAMDEAESELRRQVKAVYDRLAFENQKASDLYDHEKRHGRTQGARLNIRIR